MDGIVDIQWHTAEAIPGGHSIYLVAFEGRCGFRFDLPNCGEILRTNERPDIALSESVADLFSHFLPEVPPKKRSLTQLTHELLMRYVKGTMEYPIEGLA